MTTPFEEARAKAEEALGRGDAKAAFASLHPSLTWPGTLSAPEQWEEALDLFGRIADGMGDAALGNLLRDTSRTYNDPNSLYDLGYQLIERGLGGIGATVLSRANDLAPGKPRILGELAFALGETGRHEEAVRVLRGAPEQVDRSFQLAYLLSFHAIMTRDVDEARGRLPRLLADARGAKSTDYPPMARTIEGMVARADAVRHATPLDEDDLRGWQFVVNGQFLLHLSPHGEDVMRGRYAFVQDSPKLCHEGVRRLAALIEALELKPPRVFYLPNRESEALGWAAARELSVAVEALPAAGTTTPGLVVADELAAFPRELLESASAHGPGRLLWSQARSWTARGPFAEDCVTLLHQARTSPWGAQVQIDPATGKPVESKPVDGGADELARRILDAKVDTDDLADLPDLIQLARAACRMTGDHAPGLVRTEGKRRRFWLDSPVASARFS